MIQRNTILLVLLICILVGLAGAPLGAEASWEAQVAAQFVPGAAPPAAPPMTAAPRVDGRVAPDASASALPVEQCTQAMADPSVSLPEASSPWREERAARLFATDPVFSAPQSLRFVEDDDGLAGPTGDLDSAGQEVSLPASLSALAGSLRYRVAPGSAGAGDQLLVEIYRTGGLIDDNRLAVFALATADMDDGNWRRFDWDLRDTAALATLRGLGRMRLVVTMAGAGAQAQQIWVDEITVQRCVPAAAISGTITQRNATAADMAQATLLLTRSDSSGTQVLSRTRPDAAGAYRFDGLPSLPAGASFQIWFLNAPAGPARDATEIGSWAGPRFTDVDDGAQLSAPSFDISDVDLAAPASYTQLVATTAAPARLTWTARGITGERYQLCLYDPQRLDPATGMPVQVCSALLDPARDQMAFALSPASFVAVPQFGFRYGKSYRWYVIAYGTGEQYGSSFYERAISLVPAITPPPTATATPDPSPPAAGAAGADWTVLVYAAGDNALGDRRRAPGTALIDVQLAALAGLAPRYPQINLVTYADRYGDTGAQLCYLRPSDGPDCQARAEPNSASVATLSAVVAETRARYPADRTMLVLLGPGHALAGFGSDESEPGAPSLGAADLAAALSAGLGPGVRLDLLLLEAPLMGSLEVATALAPQVRYMVAASDQIWQVALFRPLLALLAGAQGAQPAEVAKALVAAYDATVLAQAPGLARSIAAYDLARAAAVTGALDSLGAALLDSLNQDEATTRALLAELRGEVLFYDSSANGLLNHIAGPAQPVAAAEDALVDLTQMAQYLIETPLAGEVVPGAAQALLDALAGGAPLVIAARQVSGAGAAGAAIDLTDAGGVAAFLPADVRLGHQATLAQLTLYQARATGGWASMLRAYLAGAPMRGPGGVTAGAAGGARLAPPSGGLIDWDLRMPDVGG